MSIADTQPHTGASIVKWANGRLVRDGSGALANAIYVRYEKTFNEAACYEEIAKAIREAEEKIFRLLDVEEDLA
jgi:hypothetical protein